jgi:hypothetical protein
MMPDIGLMIDRNAAHVKTEEYLFCRSCEETFRNKQSFLMHKTDDSWTGRENQCEDADPVKKTVRVEFSLEEE